MRPWLHEYPSPLGPLLLAAEPGGALVYLGFPNRLPAALDRDPRGLTPDPAVMDPVVAQLEAYFRGERRVFDLPLALRVWAELLRIPYGATISYGELARQLGDPNLTRAVGAANGANPVSIIVPCHRVIGADGSLTGYGGGLEMKRRLLALERPQSGMLFTEEGDGFHVFGEGK